MSSYEVGQAVPDVAVADAEGNLKPLSAQMGTRGMLVFVLRGTWCAFCVSQIATLQRNYHRYAAQGITSVFLTPEPADSVWSFRISQARPLQFGLHSDPKRETLEFFLPAGEVGVLPATYLIDRDLRVVWQYVGQDEEDRPSHTMLLEAIDQYLRPTSDARAAR